jgi:drug/metabolite transporter (DMT)-like permease
MNWFIAAIVGIFFVSSVWLILKKVQMKGVSDEDSLARYFVFLCFGIIIWHLATKTPISFVSLQSGMLLLVSAVFAAAANLLILLSFEKSANPGLTLVLSQTQVLWLTLAGILLFNSSISIIAGAGILLVLSGVSIIHVKKAKGGFKWGMLALAAGLMSTAYWIIVKLVQAQTHLMPSLIMLYSSIPQIFIFLLVKKFKTKRSKKKLSLATWGLLALGGLIGAFGNTTNVFAVTNAPNPGYALAVGSAGVLVTLFASIPLFKARITWRQLLAAIIIVAGVVAIRLGS